MKRALLLALLFSADTPAAVPAYTPALEGRVFDRAWRLVEEKYWDRARIDANWAEARDRYRPRAVTAPDRRAFYTILGEMLATLGDSHVYAIDPLQVAIGRDRDEGRPAQGFGFAMLPDDDGVWRVTDVRADGPAARAGVVIGWTVRAVDARPVDIDYQPAPGERARIDFEDEDGRPHAALLTAQLERPRPPRRAERLPGNLLVLTLDGFERGDDRWLDDQLGDGPPAAGVILDLRNNGGGDADVLARVAGRFFAEDRPLVLRITDRARAQRLRGGGLSAYAGPLAVLIGPDSASGAEALAALIDETGRGTTIGQRTAGALTGASDYRLPDGGALTVAEFDIRTPGGKRIEGVGVAPRIAIAPTLADRRAGRDPVLAAARHLLAAPGRAAVQPVTSTGSRAAQPLLRSTTRQ